MPKTRLHQIDQSGAVDGDVPVWDDAAGKWVPGAGALDVTSLVPLTTKTGTAPEFVWDDNDELVLTEVTL